MLGVFLEEILPLGVELPLLVAALLLMAGCSGTPTAPTPPSAPVADVPPVIACPASVPAVTIATNGAPVTYPTPPIAGGTAPVGVTCTPAPGTLFPIGTSMVSCTATDARNKTSSCTFAVVVTKVPAISRTRFVAFGDSLTSGEVTAPITTSLDAAQAPILKFVVVPAASYPTQLQQQLTARYLAQNITMVNAGKGGEWAQDGVNRLPGVLAANTPEVLLLFEGVNDDRADRAAIALEQMTRDAKARGIHVFIANMVPTRPGLRNSQDVARLTQLNEYIRQISLLDNVELVNFYDALLPDASTLIGIDGLHPTEAGYQRMAAIFFNSILPTLEVR